jgi:hypothetical protein
MWVQSHGLSKTLNGFLDILPGSLAPVELPFKISLIYIRA